MNDNAKFRRVYTLEEVRKVVSFLYQGPVYNPTFEEGDWKLLEPLGFVVNNVENGHGGYSVLRLNIGYMEGSRGKEK